MTQSTGARASDARTSRAFVWLVSMPGICFVILPALILCFWKSRVVWGAPHKPITVGVLDLYLSYFPRTLHVFERLAEGSLPLWNPFQLTGQPLSALPATGLFYPPNWLYLGVSVPVGIELHLLLHAWI